jgi:hypothetical protein
MHDDEEIKAYCEYDKDSRSRTVLAYAQDKEGNSGK